MLDERCALACYQVQKEQFPFEEVTAVVVACTDGKQGEPGMESHGMYGIPRTEKGPASQILGVVDTARCNAAEVGDARHRHVCACHCQQAAALVVDGEGWITNLGEGAVAEEPIDAERDGHGSDLLSGEKLREATGVQKLNRRT
ncbi:hypothetical protein ACFY7F_34495 [Streptomyces griseofuscus]|uniref:hypothetical protein n=1 Tax=Streptomyces griseofuscus TaxID=146922 RepID=UPI0036B2AF85